MQKTTTLLSLALTALVSTSILAQVEGPTKHDAKALTKSFGDKSYSPYVGRNFPTKPLWGDTHLHTAASLDAFAWGDKLGAEDAYRFARGEEVRDSGGMRVRLSRPLDWLVIADHAEFSGIAVELSNGNPKLLVDETTRRWSKMMNENTEQAIQATIEIVTAMGKNEAPAIFFDKGMARSLWQRHLELTDKYNEPGKFTAFNGYEWSSMPNGNNLHRVVVFKDNADKVGRIIPFSANDSVDPEDTNQADRKVVRGGSWADEPVWLRAAYRSAREPVAKDERIGFRCIQYP